MSVQAVLVARVVAETVGGSGLGIGGQSQVREAVARRVNGSLSRVPADRVATAAWLIEASGRDAPDADDLLIEAAREGLREVAAKTGWSATKCADLEGRVDVALRALPW